jgi:hypothetical protein
MSLPRPPSPDCIKDINDRIDLLLKVGPITKDLLVNAEEASAITGWSTETVRRYGVLGHISTVKYGRRNHYLAHELCDRVLASYHKATVHNTTLLNNNPRRRGRPRK